MQFPILEFNCLRSNATHAWNTNLRGLPVSKRLLKILNQHLFCWTFRWRDEKKMYKISVIFASITFQKITSKVLHLCEMISVLLCTSLLQSSIFLLSSGVLCYYSPIHLGMPTKFWFYLKKNCIRSLIHHWKKLLC